MLGPTCRFCFRPYIFLRGLLPSAVHYHDESLLCGTGSTCPAPLPPPQLPPSRRCGPPRARLFYLFFPQVLGGDGGPGRPLWYLLLPSYWLPSYCHTSSRVGGHRSARVQYPELGAAAFIS